MPIDPVPYLLAAVATRASSARGAYGGGWISPENGGGEGGRGTGRGDDRGGGVAAGACPIREPLVRYRRAPLDACKAKNLTRAR